MTHKNHSQDLFNQIPQKYFFPQDISAPVLYDPPPQIEAEDQEYLEECATSPPPTN